MKKIISMLLAVVLAIGCSATAFAHEVTTDGGSGAVPVVLTQKVTKFSVTVPTVLPVYMSATHEIEVATDAKIINNGFGPVCVKSVQVDSLKDWELVEFESDLTGGRVNEHKYGLQFMWSDVQTDGTCAVDNFPTIKGNGSMHLDYDANISVLSGALEENIAMVTFVVGWDDGSIVTGVLGVEYPWKYIVTADGTATLIEYLGDRRSGADLVVPNEIAGYTVKACAATNLSGNSVFGTVTIQDNVELAPEIFYNTTIDKLVIGKNVVFQTNSIPYGNELLPALRTPFGMSIRRTYAVNSTRTFYSGAKVKTIETHSPITVYAIFGDSSTITNVTFGPEVTTIDRQMFRGCVNLESITVQNSKDNITWLNEQSGVSISKYNFVG